VTSFHTIDRVDTGSAAVVEELSQVTSIGVNRVGRQATLISQTLEIGRDLRFGPYRYLGYFHTKMLCAKRRLSRDHPAAGHVNEAVDLEFADLGQRFGDRKRPMHGEFVHSQTRVRYVYRRGSDI